MFHRRDKTGKEAGEGASPDSDTGWVGLHDLLALCTHPGSDSKKRAGTARSPGKNSLGAVVASWMSGCPCLWRDSPAPPPYRARTCRSAQASDLLKVTEQVGSRTGLCLPAGTLHSTVNLPRGPQSGPGPHYTETSCQPSPLWITTALFS